MHRISVFLSVFILALIGMGAVLMAPSAAAQDATPVAAGDHPLIGTWLLSSDPEPGAAPSVVIFSADGGYVENEQGDISLGRWAQTGPQTGNMTFVSVFANEETGEYEGLFKIRASIEVAADGQSFAAEYTIDVVDADGTSPGEYGPGTATATRVSVETMGTPVGTLDDFFAQFEEESTPAP